MSVSYRAALWFVALVAALALLVMLWDGFDCEPECYGPPWNCGE